MLVISRKQKEAFILRDQKTGEVIAEIVLLDTTSGRARFGIDAPPSIRVVRKELLEAEVADGKPS